MAALKPKTWAYYTPHSLMFGQDIFHVANFINLLNSHCLRVFCVGGEGFSFGCPVDPFFVYYFGCIHTLMLVDGWKFWGKENIRKIKYGFRS